MAKSYFMPGSDTERVLWMNNFATKLPAYETTLSIDPSTLGSVSNDAAMWQFIVQLTEGVKTDKQEVVAYKNAIRDGIDTEPAGDVPTIGSGGTAPPTVVNQGLFARVRKLVKQLKAHPNYTVSIGEDLGIVGDEETFDPNTYKTVLQTEAFPGHVTITFTKGNVEAINLYGKLPNDSTWELLATVMHSPYMDNRPLKNPNRPETRQYRAIGVIDDEEVGQASDIVSVAFSG